MQILKLPSFPIEQVQNQTALERQLAQWWSPQRDFPTRLIAVSEACNLHPAISRIRNEQAPMDQLNLAVRPLLHAIEAYLTEDNAPSPAFTLKALPPHVLGLLYTLFADAPQIQQLLSLGEVRAGENDRQHWAVLADAIGQTLWRLPWMKEMTTFYEELQQRHLRAAHYYLMTWEPPGVSPASLRSTLTEAFRRPVELLDALPSVIKGSYREHHDCLEPLEPGQPWLALLHSYDMRDVWTAETLHALLAAPFDVAVAVDIQTYSIDKARRTVQLAHNAAQLVNKNPDLLDVRAEDIQGQSRSALRELNRQTLHELTITVLVSAPTREKLADHITFIRDAPGSVLSLMRADGYHAEIIKMFGAHLRERIEAPWKPYLQLSHAVGCMASIVTLHRRDTTDGLFFGIDAVRRSAVFIDLFANNQAAHIGILGKTGYGKTVFLNALAERAAAIHDMQVIGIDPFENGLRVERALAGATCYRVGIGEVVNLLDVVYTDEAHGGWLPNQVMHVVGQMALLFGQPGTSSDQKQIYIPRVFNTKERGVLTRAIKALYSTKHVSPETPANQMPILEDLLDLLKSARDEVADELALDLTYFLFGERKGRRGGELTTEGNAFNGQTTLDYRFRDQVTYFDFKNVPEILRPFYYLVLIGAINRWLRRRDTRRKAFVEIDEYGYASQTKAVAQLGFEFTKTARKYGAGLVLVDQNPRTFYGDEVGRQIVENLAAIGLFHLEEVAAREVGEAISDLTRENIAFLPTAEPGHALFVIKGNVYQVNVELNRRERGAFIGS